MADTYFALLSSASDRSCTIIEAFGAENDREALDRLGAMVGDRGTGFAPGDIVILRNSRMREICPSLTVAELLKRRASNG
ncbi:MAG: hypothetical protein ACM3ZV_07960 [Bacillota bacterium]